MSPNDSMTVAEAVRIAENFTEPAGKPPRGRMGEALKVLIAHAKSAPKEQIRAKDLLAEMKTEISSQMQEYRECGKALKSQKLRDELEIRIKEATAVFTCLVERLERKYFTFSLPPTEPTFTAEEAVELVKTHLQSNLYLAYPMEQLPDLIRTILTEKES